MLLYMTIMSACEGNTGRNTQEPTFSSSSFVFNLGSLNIVFLGLDAIIANVTILWFWLA